MLMLKTSAVKVKDIYIVVNIFSARRGGRERRRKERKKRRGKKKIE